MAWVHFGERTIELELAYFGPLQAGCGTNVRHLHRAQPARERTELKRLGGKDHQERMWLFTYLPLDTPRVPGFEVRVRVCSIPSGADLELDRDSMFAALDGIVFVADARAGRTEPNAAAILDLEQCLTRQGMELGALPMVFQVNQTDAQNARPLERVVEDLNPFGFPVFEAMARQGKGVLETHEALLGAVLTRLRDNLAGGEATLNLTALTRASRDKAEAAILAHVASLPQADRQVPASFGLPAAAEIPVRLPELRDSTPVQHVRTEIVGPRVRVETVYKRDDGSHRKLAILVEPGDTPVPLSPPSTPHLHTASHPPPVRRMPASDELPGELPRLTYGFGGLLGGLLAGLFLGYIWFG